MTSDLWLDCFLRPPGFDDPGPGPGGGGDAGGGCTYNCGGETDCGSEIYWSCDDSGIVVVCSPTAFDWDTAGEGDEENCFFKDSFIYDGRTYYKDKTNCQNDPTCDLGSGGGGGTPGGPSTPPVEPPETTTWWICSGFPLWFCFPITIPSTLPPPPGAWLDPKDCLANCKGDGRGGPGTPGDVTYDCWRCPPYTPGPGGPQCCVGANKVDGECPDRYQDITEDDCNADCTHTCYKCIDIGITSFCIPLNANCSASCPSLGAYDSAKDCRANCTSDGGGTSPGDTPGNCWVCPPFSPDTGQKCCEQTAVRDANGICPIGSMDSQSDCNSTCTHTCHICKANGNDKECVTKVGIPCDITCEESGGWSKLQDCKTYCLGDSPPPGGGGDVNTDCWRCPGTSYGGKRCCEQNAPRLDDGSCPKGTHAEAAVCDNNCVHGCHVCMGTGEDKYCGYNPNVPCNLACADIGGWDTVNECRVFCEDGVGGGSGSTDCWKCPKGSGGVTECCKQECARNDDGSCPDNCHEFKSDCDANCKKTCWECSEPGEEGCTFTKIIDCNATCEYSNKGECDYQEECLTFEGKDFCWECPDIFDPGAGCCTDTAPKLPDGTCPPSSYDKKRKCEKNCRKNCWKCNEGDCGEVPILCSQECSEEGYYDSKEDCEEYCEDPPCRLTCYDCIGTGGPGDREDNESDLGGDECRAIVISCEDGETCEGEGYFTDDDCNGQCPGTGESYFGEDEEASEVAYASNVVDPVYERNVNNRKYFSNNPKYLPVRRQTTPSGIFNNKVHASLEAVNIMNNSNILFSDYPYTNLSDYHIEQSLSLPLRALLNDVKLATGESIKPRVLQTIRQLIISNRINTMDPQSLIEYLSGIQRAQANYPESRGAGESRPSRGASAEAKAITLAKDKAWSLAPNDYAGVTSERIRVWKTLATDLNKYFPIRTKENTLFKLYYDDRDVAPLGTGGIYMSVGNVQHITKKDGSVAIIPVPGDYQRARVLQLEDLQRLLFILGDTYSFTMNVSTEASSRVDERYDVENAREDYYFLRLDPDTVQSEQRDQSLVSITKANYVYTPGTEAINEWIKYRPWPYMVFHVDDTDPILSYITNSEGDGTISITSKDFTLDIFEDNEDIPIFVRRLLQYIVIVPSDKDDNVMEHQISTQVDYGERELTFFVNPDPERSDIFTPTHIKEVFTYPSPGISPFGGSKDAVSYEFNLSAITDSHRYKSGSPNLPRPAYGMRLVLSTLHDYRNNYELENNSVGWDQVYLNVDRSKMKHLHIENKDWSTTKSLLNLGIISTDEEVNSKYAKPRDVPSTGKKITDPDFGAEFNLTKKKDQIPPEPL